MIRKKQKGVIIVLVIIFEGIFLILLGGLSGLIILQLRQSLEKAAWTRSLQVAEAGVNFYRWCLNHEIDCPVENDFFDPEGNKIGRFFLGVSSISSCDQTMGHEVVSTGWTDDFPDIQRKVKALYGRISVSQYAYLLNDNVWAGADREIRGLYHSNGGIRMDGENQSLVTSSRDSWLCTLSFGCFSWDCPQGCVADGDACSCPGVFTTTDNSNPDLFDFPVPSFDFEGITIELAQIKELTSSYPQEKYWPPSTDIDANAKGYHLKFFEDGTFEVWLITELEATYAYSLEEGWHDDYFTIKNEYLYGQFSIDPGCSLLYFEDNLWVEGKVKGKVTVVSADLLNPTKDTTVVLPSNIEYTLQDGSDGLAMVGQKDVLISPDSPNNMELRGIFIAQKGRFGRNLYLFNIKDKLEIHGSIISKGRVGTKWSSGSIVISGYLERENYIDSNLIYFPPPFVPHISPDFEIVNWEEVEE